MSEILNPRYAGVFGRTCFARAGGGVHFIPPCLTGRPAVAVARQPMRQTKALEHFLWKFLKFALKCHRQGGATGVA